MRGPVIPPGGGEVVGDSPDRRVEILSDHETLHATWSRFGPRREGAALHIHRRHTDLFYVLDGELTVLLGREGEPVVVPAGTLARVPPLVVHGFRNAADAELRYLNFHAPGQGFADYLRALRDVYDQEPPPVDGVRPASEAVVGGDETIAGRRLLCDAETIAIVERGADEPSPPHVHARHAQSLFVLDGEVTLTLAGREHRAPRGAWAQVPPGAAHSISATGRFLSVHTPGCGYGAFLRALAETGDVQAAAARSGFDQAPAS